MSAASRNPIWPKLRCISPKEAQAQYESGNKKPWRMATLTRAVKGGMSSYRKGEIVKVQSSAGSGYSIQRARWRGSMVPLANAMYGVPRSALRFHEVRK